MGAEPKKSRHASSVVSVAILLSRVLGLVREQVFAHYLGNSSAAGAFRAALRIPNFLQNLFGEGVLSASFIPVYSRLRATGDETTARAVAGAVGAILALVVSLCVLLGIVFTSAIVDLVAPGFEGGLRELTIRIVRILFPGVGLLAIAAWCLGILNSHRRFFVSYAAPVLWNLALIATLWKYGSTDSQDDLVVKLAWGSLLGSVLQLGVQVPFVFRAAGPFPMTLGRGLGAVRSVFMNLGPVLLGRGVVQLSAYIDGIIASYLGATAVAGLAYAQTIFLLPVSLFGMAVAAAELPELSVQAADTDAPSREKLRARIASGKRRIAFFVIPSSIACIFLGRQMIHVLFQTGRFGGEDTLYVWYLLAASAVGLLATTWARLYSSGFYALMDTRTPLKFAALRVSLSIALGLLLAFPLRPWITELIALAPGLKIPAVDGIEMGIGAIGISLASGVVGWIESLLLSRSLRGRIGALDENRGVFLKVAGLSLVAAAFAWVAEHVARGAWIPASELWSRGISLATLGAFGVVYLALAKITRTRRS